MRVFEIGDKIETIDDTITGVVIQVLENEITIESEDGFPMKYAPSELIVVPEAQTIRVSKHEADRVKAEKELPKRRKTATVSPKERNIPKMEVDLHIHKLTKSDKGMSHHEMLNLQLDTAKGQLEFAIRKRIQKVVFIHGVGEGVLKEELHYLFRRYDNIKYYDAEYRKYGTGATEVYIFQNG